jgi:hypothetical protein
MPGNFLQFKFNDSEIELLLQVLNELHNDIDFNHNSDGLGLYVSPKVIRSIFWHK